MQLTTTPYTNIRITTTVTAIVTATVIIRAEEEQCLGSAGKSL